MRRYFLTVCSSLQKIASQRQILIHPWLTICYGYDDNVFYTVCGNNDLFLFSALTAPIWSQRPLIQANAPGGR